MTWSGGAFTRIGGSTHWVDDKNAAINIVASRHDTNDEDLAGGINFCLNKDGTSAPTGDFTPAVDNTKGLGTALLRWASLNGDSITAGTFLGTLTGCTTAPTVTITYIKLGRLVVLNIPTINATSNASTMTITGLPVILKPLTVAVNMPMTVGQNNGVSIPGIDCFIALGGTTLFFSINSLAANWTASGIKGLANTTFAYFV